MRNRLIACLSLLTTFGTAYAAAPCPDDRFNGFYVGANISETVWTNTWVDRDAWVDNFGNDWALGTVVNNVDDFGGGLQLGYNWRCPNSLFGVEFDWTWVSGSTNKNYTPTPTNDTNLNLRHELNSYGTLRGRAGLVADNLLLYVTAGAAFARFNHDWAVFSPPNAESTGLHGTKWGGVGGVGAELLVTPDLSIKVEGLYFTFAEDTTSLLSVAGTNQTVNFDTHNSFVAGRIGFNYNLSCFF